MEIFSSCTDRTFTWPPRSVQRLHRPQPVSHHSVVFLIFGGIDIWAACGVVEESKRLILPLTLKIHFYWPLPARIRAGEIFGWIMLAIRFSQDGEKRAVKTVGMTLLSCGCKAFILFPAFLLFSGSFLTGLTNPFSTEIGENSSTSKTT